MATQPQKSSSFQTLPFEKPIHELEAKIAELKELSHESSLDLDVQISGLKARLDALVTETFHTLTPWEAVRVARATGRPLADDYVEQMCDEFIELKGDRAFREDPAILTGFGRIGSQRVLMVAHRKGKDLKERIACHFGCAHPEGYRKAIRKMRLAEKLNIPIVCLIDTPGAYPGVGAEERGQAWAIAENLQEMFRIRVPIVCVVIGEGGSGGALGIGIGDRVLMLQHAYYSVISPEGCAAILWNDAKRASDAAEALKIGAKSLHEFGIVDEIVDEPLGAAHRDPSAAIQRVKERILFHLETLKDVPSRELMTGRMEKFRRMGTLFGEGPAVTGEPQPPEGAGVA